MPKKIKGNSAIFIIREREDKVTRKMIWTTVVVWIGVATILLISQVTSWAMEKGEARSFTPEQFRLNQLLAPERVIDSNPASVGMRGNSVPNLQKWNAMLLQSSHSALRQQGAGTSPDGEVASQKRQKVELQMGRTP